MSELIRQTLEKGIDQDPAASARAFFNSFEPLESFKNVDADTYLREIRSTSRLLRSGMHYLDRKRGGTRRSR